MVFGHSFKSGGLRSRSKDLSLWVNLLSMNLKYVMWLGHLIGKPQCQYLHVMNLFICSFSKFNEHLILYQPLLRLAYNSH